MLSETVFWSSAALFAYHHFGYPLLLAGLAARAKRTQLAAPPPPVADGCLPSIALIVPAHNEEAVIADKIANLAAIDYPADRLRIIVVCDGCNDATPGLARQAIRDHAAADRITLDVRVLNAGKVATLNDVIGAVTADIVALGDTSAVLEPDCLRRVAAHFADARVGVVCGTYELSCPGSEGEAAYWRYQRRIKAREAAVAAPLGAHGAFYAFRRAAWRPLEPDTINDDFILPMRIVAQGYRAVYDEEIVARELEVTASGQDFRRRMRIGAGNLQQALRLWPLYDPRRPGVAFLFASGKALRAFMPFIMVAGAAALVSLASEGRPMYLTLLVAAVVGLSLVVVAARRPAGSVPAPLAWVTYLVQGHAAALAGSLKYLAGGDRGPWKRAADTATGDDYIPRSVAAAKRVFDIVCALGALVVLAVLFVPIALAIRLDSRGPIFYRQLRVGRQTPTATHLFYLIKFRTMRIDAEQQSGAVWAAKNDPRVTRVGRFLRKTRLDELPQAINVLRGEMSAIGPRPERPVFFKRLEAAIPFYSERTFGLRPGITGLAQVNQAYDESIEDVRNKVLYDHAYATRLGSLRNWFLADVGIVLMTLKSMALGKGQ